jgi:hypothetical protein
VTSTDDETHELHSQAMATLLGAAETSGEMNALTRVGRRAGFLWTCPGCRQDNYANRDACCGKPRPNSA